MKSNRIFILTFLCLLGSFSFAQLRFDWGEKFEFDPNNEKDVKFALVDNYNIFLTSYTDVYGMMAEHKIIVRKFDQKNQLIDTFTTDFPTFEKGAYYNYIGSAETGNGKIVFYTEAYSGKAKKKEISQTVFDKSTGSFTSSVITTYTIESTMKSGTTYFELSPNKVFAAIRHQKHSGRKDPQANFLTVINLQDLSVLWSKEHTFQDGFHAKYYGVSNAGNLVIVAADKATKVQDYLLLGTASGFEKKEFNTYVEAQRPTIINIGQKEYVIAFNKEVKGIIRDPYENVLLFDLEGGNIIANNKAVGLYSHKDIVDVFIRNVFVDNNEITLFSEAKLKAGTKDKQSAMGTMSIPTAYYHFRPAHMLTLSLEGEIKNTRSLSISNENEADLYHSFGALPINGKFYYASGLYLGVFEVLPTGKTDKTVAQFNTTGDPYFNKTAIRYVNQLFVYMPDSGKFIMARTIDNNGMSLVNVYGADLR